MNSLYWFDYETFGTHPAWDRPCQFAGVRTDMDLNEIEPPLVIYCQQSPDYLPQPQACRVTGLTPQHVNERGVPENRFIRQIVNEIGRPGTCSLGYNSIKFDDEFSRHTLFRNFFDAYEYEYKDGNSRWDLLDVVRLTRALRPDGIEWPVNEEGRASNRLEQLSAANAIEHGHAHDALSDVRATIGMAKLIKRTQPKLFDYAFTHRGKQAVSQMLNTAQPKLCLQLSGIIPASRAHLSPVLPLIAHPDNRNGVIVLDLHDDPSPLLTMDADQIAGQLFRKTSDTTAQMQTSPGSMNSADAEGGCYRPGLRTIQINKCPVLVPLATLLPPDAERLGVDVDQWRAHEHIARALLNPDKLMQIQQAMCKDWPSVSSDVEGSLYSGKFLSPADRQRASELRDSQPRKIAQIAAHFEDRRLSELAFRYLARNYPESMDADQSQRWEEHCQQRLTDDTQPWLSFDRFDEQMAGTQWTAEDADLKLALEQYATGLKQRWLSHCTSEQPEKFPDLIS